MNFKTLVWNNLHARIWLLVASITMVLVFTVTMFATQLPVARNNLYMLWGYPQAIVGEERGLYQSDYPSKADVFTAANEFNAELTSEGFTLLQNKGNVLPLAKGASVSVFGRNSVDLLYGGSGSGDNSSLTNKTIFDSLDAADIGYNNTLKSFYEAQTGRPAKAPGFDTIIAGYPTGETKLVNYTTEVTNSYSDHSDAALVVVTRIGGEGFDLPRTMSTAYTATGIETEEKNKIEGARNNTNHYLELDQNEVDLLLHVTENFDKVILIINSNNPLELGFLDDPGYWANTLGVADTAKTSRAINHIRGALWIGSPGTSGIMALGSILNGDTNPSGRTVDIYSRDFTKDPAYQNFGNNNMSGGNAYLNPNGSDTGNARTYFVEYEEGIYVGYRYYETRGFNDKAAWYGENVMYPFGHGLSYSEFDWKVGDMKLDNAVISNGSTLSASDSAKTVSVEVTVTNKSTSNYAGKDVVQLYVGVPYYENGIEKSHVSLMDFAKTKLLEPGKPETLTLSFSLYDIASYDYNDDNGNGFKGWETEAGEYKIYISKNSHSWASSDNALIRSFTVPQTKSEAKAGKTGFTYLTDPFVENSAEIINRFDDVSYGRKGDKVYLSRNNWEKTMPAAPTNEERRLDTTQGPRNIYGAWCLSAETVAENDTADRPWYVSPENMPDQASGEVSTSEAIKLYDMLGIAYDDERWEAFLDQLTFSQMHELVGVGAFRTVALTNIEKPFANHLDGPAGFTNFVGGDVAYDTCFYASECVIGATFNKELACQFGKMIGDEGLIGNENGDKLPYSGWYAPAVNIHRSPFSGRNWEYFSEDPVLSGIMGAQVVIGAKEKGIITFAKHFALNDQETSRSSRGLFTWANEQSMREIYFKAFEILVKEGKSIGMMTSFNRIGTTWTGGDYRLLTEILRNEWGFKGVVITDFADKDAYMYADQMIRAGGDLQLLASTSTLTKDTKSATHVTALRNASKNILYATLNSNAMNYEILGYNQPVWITALIWINIGLLTAFVIWGAVAIFLSYKKIKTAGGDALPDHS